MTYNTVQCTCLCESVYFLTYKMVVKLIFNVDWDFTSLILLACYTLFQRWSSELVAKERVRPLSLGEYTMHVIVVYALFTAGQTVEYEAVWKILPACHLSFTELTFVSCGCYFLQRTDCTIQYNVFIIWVGWGLTKFVSFSRCSQLEIIADGDFNTF